MAELIFKLLTFSSVWHMDSVGSTVTPRLIDPGFSPQVGWSVSVLTVQKGTARLIRDTEQFYTCIATRMYKAVYYSAGHKPG